MERYSRLIYFTIFFFIIAVIAFFNFNSNADWIIQTVDSEGDVGWYASLALDSNDRPHIAYYDWTNDDLKYAYWNGSAWIIQTVDYGGFVTLDASLALDSNDRPHIAYYDDLKYAYWNGSAWIIQTVDEEHGGSCVSFALVSLALDSNDRPHIAYYDGTNGDLKYAYWNGYDWIIQTVDSSGDVGLYASLALDSNDRPHIAYYDDTNNNLKYAYWNGYDWTIQTVDSEGNVGVYASLALDSNDRPHIAYFDGTNYDLKYAYWNGYDWIIQTVDSSGDVGWYASLALDTNDRPHIAYYDWTNDDLKYAYWNGYDWIIQTVDYGGFVGEFASLALDSNDRPHIAYYDGTNYDLKYAYCFSISISSPSYGSKWYMGKTYTITWDSEGTSGYVDIELYYDEDYEMTIASHVYDDGSYEWSISTNLTDSSFYRIKIVDSSDANLYAFSDYFTISSPSISISSPSYGSKWYMGKTYTITWDSEGTSGYVDIELYYDEDYEMTIASHVYDDGSYEWSISTNLTDSSFYRIKIVDSSDANLYAFSDYFTISSPSISISSPSYGSKWYMGKTYTITWDSEGTSGYVDIELYYDEDYEMTIASHVYDDGSYEWSISTNLTDSSFYRIKIVDSSDANLYAFSDYFTISSPSISISSPSYGSKWYMGKTYTITWDSEGTSGYVDIELYYDEDYEMTIASHVYDDGSYEWSISTNLTDSSFYRIKIVDSSDANLYAFSDYFTISSPSISISSPSYGSKWYMGKTYTITWDSEGTSGYVDIELYRSNNHVLTIASHINDDGNYEWNIPENLEQSKRYKIKVTDSYNDSIYDYSSYFWIYPEPYINIISPSGGTLRKGKTYVIEWDSQGVDYVTIRLYKYSPEYFYEYVLTIVDDIQNTGEYEWKIPKDIEDGIYKIRIINDDDSYYYEDSSPFHIKPPLFEELAPWLFVAAVGIIGIVGGVYANKWMAKKKLQEMRQKVQKWKEEGYKIEELERKLQGIDGKHGKTGKKNQSTK